MTFQLQPGLARPPIWPIHRFFCGVDVGKEIDPSAVCVVEKRWTPVEGDVTTQRTDVKTEVQYGVRYLERLELGLSYTVQVAHVRRLVRSPMIRGNVKLIVDGTGCGGPVVDMFRDTGLTPVKIMITSGASWKRTYDTYGYGYNISKLALMSRLQVMLHGGDLHVEESLNEWPVLSEEIKNFQMRATDSGNVQLEARQGTHDDLVLALACAVWEAHATHRPNLAPPKPFTGIY